MVERNPIKILKTHVQQLDLVYIFTIVRGHASSSRTRLCFNSFDSFLQRSFDENESKRSTMFTRLFRCIVPFLDASKLSWGDTYSMSYTSVVFGNTALSLFILYTAYLNATSVVLSLSSCVKIAPVKKRKTNKFISRGPLQYARCERLRYGVFTLLPSRVWAK